MDTEKRLRERAEKFELCFAELSLKSRQDLDNRIRYLASIYTYMGEDGVRELIMQVARKIDPLTGGMRKE